MKKSKPTSSQIARQITKRLSKQFAESVEKEIEEAINKQDLELDWIGFTTKYKEIRFEAIAGSSAFGNGNEERSVSVSRTLGQIKRDMDIWGEINEASDLEKWSRFAKSLIKLGTDIETHIKWHKDSRKEP